MGGLTVFISYHSFIFAEGPNEGFCFVFAKSQSILQLHSMSVEQNIVILLDRGHAMRPLLFSFCRYALLITTMHIR